MRRLLAYMLRPGRRRAWARYKEAGTPVTVFQVGDAGVKLYPWGQIPELLYVFGFEHTEINQVSRLLKPNMQILDIGANIGLYSIIASKAVGPAGKIWAFEPSSQTIEYLRKNLQENECDNVHITQSALSDTDGGFLTLERDSGFGDGERHISQTPQDHSTSSKMSSKTDDPGDTELVPITTLDAWAAANEVPTERIDFIKIDVEGFEFPVLRGGVQLLAANPNLVIMFECEAKYCVRYGYKQKDLHDFLRAQGFQLFGYDTESEKWNSDGQFLLNTSNIWACKDPTLLPSG